MKRNKIVDDCLTCLYFRTDACKAISGIYGIKFDCHVSNNSIRRTRKPRRKKMKIKAEEVS